MSKNNITISDIESRHFHVNDYKEQLPPWSWTRTSNWSVRGKINFIFKSFDSRGLYPKSTQTITGRDHIIDPVKLISFRYEIRENKLKEALSIGCGCSGDIGEAGGVKWGRCSRAALERQRAAQHLFPSAAYDLPQRGPTPAARALLQIGPQV